MYRFCARCLNLNNNWAICITLNGKGENYMQKERRDVVKSKAAIKQAFIKLCINQKTEKITVTKILDEANVSRGTFYAHFQDIYDVKEQVEEDLLSVCKSSLQKADIHDIIQDPYPQILPVVQFFADNARTIRSLSAYSESSFIEKYKRILLQGIQESEHTLDGQAVVVVIDACIVGAIIDGALEMIMHEREHDSAKTARLISQFIAKGLQGFQIQT